MPGTGGLCLVPADSDDSVRATENLGVFSQSKSLKICPGNVSEVSGGRKIRFRSLKQVIFVFVKEICQSKV